MKKNKLIIAIALVAVVLGTSSCQKKICPHFKLQSIVSVK
jgi:hypothetical protein